MVRYEFDGEQLTAGQISKRYPVYSRATVARACAEGCKNLADLQARDRACAARIDKVHSKNARSIPPLLGIGSTV